MTTVHLADRPVLSTAVALLLPGQPMPPPWCSDPARLICDLCDQSTEHLWPLATAPAEDELLPAGELLICHPCAEAIRPVPSTSTEQLVDTTMSDPGSAPTLTY
jgi:hypothetical protein